MSVDPATVDENLDGVLIGLLAAADSDPGDSHTFAVVDPRFEVVGNELRLVVGQSLDFEANPNVTVAVTATDQPKSSSLAASLAVSLKSSSPVVTSNR